MCADQPAVREQANIAGASARRHVRDVEDHRRPELDVRHQRAVRLPRAQLLDRGPLELLGHLEARRAEIHRGSAEEPRARVLGAVDAMTEAHQPLAAVEQVIDVLLDRVGRRCSVQHRQHARRGAAVQRPGECADRRRERGAAVGARRGDDPSGEGGRVEPVLGGADPVRVDRLHVLGIGLAAPLEQEAGRRRRPARDELRVDRSRGAVREARRLGDDGEHRRGDPGQVVPRLFVGDVDELLQVPLAGEVCGDRLHVGGRVARQVARGVWRSRPQAGLRVVVHEEPPDLLERDAADEVLDVDAPVAQCPAVAIGLCDLRLEGDDALEARLELAHGSPRSSAALAETLPDRSRPAVPYAHDVADGGDGCGVALRRHGKERES